MSIKQQIQSIAARIEEIARSQNKSMRETSLGAGLSEDYLSKMKRRGSEPELRSLMKLAEFLNVPITEFFDDSTDYTDRSGISKEDELKNLALLLQFFAVSGFMIHEASGTEQSFDSFNVKKPAKHWLAFAKAMPMVIRHLEDGGDPAELGAFLAGALASDPQYNRLRLRP